jgi:hypothetical protein
MKTALRNLLFAAFLLLPGVAFAQCSFPTPVPANVVIGRLGVGPGPCQAIPFATLSSKLTGSTITLNSGNGQTAPGAMSGGNTYSFGATTDTPQFTGAGFGGAAPATGLEIYNAAVSPTLNGQGVFGASSTNGGILAGQGSTYDAVVGNKSLAVAMGVLTGTQNVVFAGNMTAAALLTSGTITGAVCMDASGHFIYAAAVNCFTVSGISVTAGKTLTVTNTITLSGTDGTTMTLPGASTTLAGLATNQTFSGTDTFSGTFNVSGTCQIAGVACGTFITQNYATPPAIGGTTPAAGSFTTLTATTPIALTSGGTNASTAAGARASAGLNVDGLTPHGDTNYQILATDRTVATSTTLTASRTWTLPAASSVNAGQHLYVQDFKGFVSNTNTLIIIRNGSDNINGGTGSQTINNANGGFLFISDGVSNWSAQALGAQATSGVASINGQTGNPSIVSGTAITVSTTGGNITVANAGATSVNNQTGAAVVLTPPAGRLTLISGVPEINVDTVGAQNVYYGPDGPGNLVPIYNGTVMSMYPFTSSATDQVGLTCALGGSSTWAAGTIFDVLITLNGGSPVCATRKWDSSMLPTGPTLITPSTSNTCGGAPCYITTGTGSTAWVRASAAFDGTVSKTAANSAVVAPSNTGTFANCSGQDWGSGNTQVLTQVVVTAPSDQPLFNSGLTFVQVVTQGSNDASNWQILDVRNVNPGTNGATYTISINASNNIPYRYNRWCVTGDGSSSVRFSQLQFFNSAGPITRRITKYNGILTNDALTTSTEICSNAACSSVSATGIAANQGTFVGTFQTDAGSAGQVSAYVNYGPSRVYNLWNAYNQRTINLRAGVPFLSSTQVYNYALTSTANVDWAPVQATTTFSMTILIGYAYEPLTVDMRHTGYANCASGAVCGGFEAGVGIDTTHGFSGTEVNFDVDTNTGWEGGLSGIAPTVTLPPFFGTHTFYGLHKLTYPASTATISIFTDIRGTMIMASWKG